MLNTIPPFLMLTWVCNERTNESKPLNDNSYIFSLELYGHLTICIPMHSSCSHANSNLERESQEGALGKKLCDCDHLKDTSSSQYVTDEQLAGGVVLCTCLNVEYSGCVKSINP